VELGGNTEQILSLTPARRRFTTQVDVSEEHPQNEPLKLGRREQTDLSATPSPLADGQVALGARADSLLARQHMAAVAGGSDAK